MDSGTTGSTCTTPSRALSGVRRYAQSHFLPEHRLTEDHARALDADGLAATSFGSEADRALCYVSKQEELCGVDSLLFIAAAARYVSDVENLMVAELYEFSGSHARRAGARLVGATDEGSTA